MDILRSVFGFPRSNTTLKRNNQSVLKRSLQRTRGFRYLNGIPAEHPPEIPVNTPRRGLRRTGAFRGLETIQTRDTAQHRLDQIPVDLTSLLEAFPSSGYTPAEAVSVQIHRAFAKINKEALFSALLAQTGAITVPAMTDTEFSDYILSTLETFIDTMANSNTRKNSARKDLENIYANMLKRMKFSKIYRQVIVLCLEYVKLQPPDFQRAYAYFYALDCAHAYSGSNGMSCALGILERFVSSLSSAATIYIGSPEYTERGYDRLVDAIENQEKSLRKRIEDAGAPCFQKYSENEAGFRDCIKGRLRDEMGARYNNSAISTELNTYIPILGVFGGGRRKTRKLKKKSRK
jgi:hypothetical protein